MQMKRWFLEEWKRDDETRTAAMLRLSLEAPLAIATLRKALAGEPVSPTSASKIAALSAGKVRPESLVFPEAAA